MRNFNLRSKGPKSPTSKKRRRNLRSKPRQSSFESLETRQLLAVTASFSPSTGILRVVGDRQDNVIEISRTENGQIEINDGDVRIKRGTPTVENTQLIFGLGLGGNDQISLNDSSGALPNAMLLGGSGDDLIVGGAGEDVLLGGDGNDTIRGGGSDDRILGGLGSDVLSGEGGSDRVEGSDGNDLLIWNSGDGSDIIDGGADRDVVQVNGDDAAGDDFSIAPNGERVQFQRNNLGPFTLDIGTTEELDVNGQGGSDVITGSAGLNGLISLDLDGGEGDDTLTGGDGDDVLRGGAGSDALFGNRGDDVMAGESGSDLLVWNDGDGSDLMEGGSDTDTVQVNGSDDLGDDFSIDPNGERVRLQRNNLSLFSLDIGTAENLNVNGQGGDDVITGSAGLNGLISLDLDGGDGDDTLTGGDGADVLRGGAGEDTLLGKQGSDTVLGEDGNDLLVVNDGDGSDFLEGGPDADTVEVNTGSDARGDDLRIEPNGDRVRLRRNNLEQFLLNIGTTENLHVNGQGGGDVIIASPGLANLTSLDLDGGDGDDLVIGSDGPDTIRGGRGNDTLLGRQDNDVVLGGDGDDQLNWNNGDGSDQIEGGAGSDTVQVNTDDSIGDRIEVDPFNSQRVLVRRTNLEMFVLDIGTAENLDVNLLGGNDVAVASAGLRDLIALDFDGGDGNDLMLGGDGDDVLRGGNDKDTLLGLGGDDVVLGEDGDDLIFVNDGQGSDVVEGGQGNDTVQVNGSFVDGDVIQVAPHGTRVTVERTNLEPYLHDIGTAETLDINLFDGDDRVTASVGLADLITLDIDGGRGDDVITGGDGPDRIAGGSGVDLLRGRGGNDTLIGNQGDDFIFGEDGNDLIVINEGHGSNLIEGGDGRDTVQIATSNVGVLANQEATNETPQFGMDANSAELLGGVLPENSAVSGAGRDGDLATLSDAFEGQSRDDWNPAIALQHLSEFGIDDGVPAETLTLLSEQRDSDAERHDQTDDGSAIGLQEVENRLASLQASSAGGDEITLSRRGRTLQVSRTNIAPFTQTIGAAEVLDLRSSAGDDRVTLQGLAAVPNLETIIIDTQDGDDVINATALDAAFALIARGRNGNDTLFGGHGNDILLGEDGRDIIIGNAGNDFVSGGEGDDILISGDGDDVILGANGNDVLSGGRGNDILLAGDGNDVMNGGADTDFLDGGAGQDSAINGETVINVP